MNLRSWSWCSLVVSMSLLGVHAQADDSVQQPTLGTPQLIGVLSTLSLEAEVKVAALGESYEEPVLGQPILLASLIVEEVDSAVSMEPADPEKIQEHLQQAAHLLTAAGLCEQSHAVRSVLSEFKSRHADRLALNRKRAELARLQAEIERLASQVGSEEPLVPVGFASPQE